MSSLKLNESVILCSSSSPCQHYILFIDIHSWSICELCFCVKSWWLREHGEGCASVWIGPVCQISPVSDRRPPHHEEIMCWKMSLMSSYYSVIQASRGV